MSIQEKWEWKEGLAFYFDFNGLDCWMIEMVGFNKYHTLNVPITYEDENESNK